MYYWYYYYTTTTTSSTSNTIIAVTVIFPHVCYCPACLLLPRVSVPHKPAGGAPLTAPLAAHWTQVRYLRQPSNQAYLIFLLLAPMLRTAASSTFLTTLQGRIRIFGRVCALNVATLNATTLNATTLNATTLNAVVRY